MIFLGSCCVTKDRKVLLLKQTEKGDQAFKWGPPGGHLEGSETVEECAIRETFEECGLKVEIVGLIQTFTAFYKNQDYISVFYATKFDTTQEIKIQEQEVSDYAWATLEDLKSGKYPLRKEFLRSPLIKSLEKQPVETDIFQRIEIE